MGAVVTSKPGRWWYGVAAAVLVVGVGVFIGLLYSGISGMGKAMQRGVVPGQFEVQVEKPGTQIIYHEFQSVMDGKVFSSRQGLQPLQIRVVAKESGTKVSTTKAGANSTYTYGSYSGRSILSFEASQPGTYALSVVYAGNAAGPEFVLAVGPSFGSGLVFTILSAVITLLVTIGLSAVIAIVTFVKRRQA